MKVTESKLLAKPYYFHTATYHYKLTTYLKNKPVTA